MNDQTDGLVALNGDGFCEDRISYEDDLKHAVVGVHALFADVDAADPGRGNGRINADIGDQAVEHGDDAQIELSDRGLRGDDRETRSGGQCKGGSSDGHGTDLSGPARPLGSSKSALSSIPGLAERTAPHPGAARSTGGAYRGVAHFF